jgi:hypothetical protein
MRKIVLAALDALGLALAAHGHVWTAQERRAYERAVRALTAWD